MTSLVAAILVSLATTPKVPAQQSVQDSIIVVELQQETDSALAMVLQAFSQAEIEVAIASAEQGLVLSQTERLGRGSQVTYAQFRAHLIGLGPITRVVLSGILAPTENLEQPVTVTSGAFFNGALVWARLQWVGRELRKADGTG